MPLTKSQAGALGGRPRKLDDAQCRRLSRLLKTASLKEAAAAYGITTRAILYMRKQGRVT